MLVDEAAEILRSTGTGSLRRMLDELDVPTSELDDQQLSAVVDAVAREFEGQRPFEPGTPKSLESVLYALGWLDRLAETLRPVVLDADLSLTLVTTLWMWASNQRYLPQHRKDVLIWDGDRALMCTVCSRNSAAEPVNAGDPFPSGHIAPPAHGRCRCTLRAPRDISYR